MMIIHVTCTVDEFFKFDVLFKFIEFSKNDELIKIGEKNMTDKPNGVHIYTSSR